MLLRNSSVVLQGRASEPGKDRLKNLKEYQQSTGELDTSESSAAPFSVWLSSASELFTVLLEGPE
jgi:hypothetical protein